MRERGKQHNPVTGSGGMFVGRVATIGEALRDAHRFARGRPHRVARLADADAAAHRCGRPRRRRDRPRVAARQRDPFRSGPLCETARRHRRNVALAVLDVAGAPAQVARLAQPGRPSSIIGADGKSGMLSCAQAKRKVGAERARHRHRAPTRETAGAQLLLATGSSTHSSSPTRRNALDVVEKFATAAPASPTSSINCVNVPGTELASILVHASDDGIVYFFSMATSFTAAALGAEGVGNDVTMIIGNGYAKGHAQTALQTLRDHPDAARLFHANTKSAIKERAMTDTTEYPPSQAAGAQPDQFEYKNLKQGEFWRHIPAYADVDEATFLDHLWQQKNAVKTADELLDDDQGRLLAGVLRRRGSGFQRSADGGPRFALRDRVDRLERSVQRSDPRASSSRSPRRCCRITRG